MAGFNGRVMTVEWDNTVIAGVRTRGFTINNEHVDVTNDDDSGWRTLLATPGLRSVEVTVGGITTNEALLSSIMAASVSGETIEVNLPSSLANPGNISGTFMISSFEQTGEYNGAVEFTATFMSSGQVTYTASTA